MARNEKYSFKDFKDQDLSGLDPSEFNGKGDVVGLCICQEFIHGEAIPTSGGRKVFPPGMAGVTFKRCNLDNVELPAGNFVVAADGINSTQKTIQQQNDLEDWEMEYKDGVWVAKQPIMIKQFLEYGISTDPADIPVVKREGTSRLGEKSDEAIAALGG
jgi:hypothetical protein